MFFFAVIVTGERGGRFDIRRRMYEQGGQGWRRHLDMVYLIVEVEGNRGSVSRLCNSVWALLTPAPLVMPLITHVIVSQGGR